MILLTREEALALLLEAQDVRQKMDAKGINSRRPEGSTPMGTITCGELIRMNRGLMMMAWQLYPELADPDVVEQTIRSAAVREAGGAVN